MEEIKLDISDRTISTFYPEYKDVSFSEFGMVCQVGYLSFEDIEKIYLEIQKLKK